MNSAIIAPYDVPQNCPIDHTLFAPRLLPGETVQGFLTAVYNPPRVRTEIFHRQPYSHMALSELLWASHYIPFRVPHSNSSQEDKHTRSVGKP